MADITSEMTSTPAFLLTFSLHLSTTAIRSSTPGKCSRFNPATNPIPISSSAITTEVAPPDPEAACLRQLLLAGAALGCTFDFAVRGRCPTRARYLGDQGWERIWAQARASEKDFDLGSREMLALFRIREFGE